MPPHKKPPRHDRQRDSTHSINGVLGILLRHGDSFRVEQPHARRDGTRQERHTAESHRPLLPPPKQLRQHHARGQQHRPRHLWHTLRPNLRRNSLRLARRRRARHRRHHSLHRSGAVHGRVHTETHLQEQPQYHALVLRHPRPRVLHTALPHIALRHTALKVDARPRGSEDAESKRRYRVRKGRSRLPRTEQHRQCAERRRDRRGGEDLPQRARLLRDTRQRLHGATHRDRRCQHRRERSRGTEKPVYRDRLLKARRL